MEQKVPEYYQYLTWFCLDNALGLYEFVQVMIDDDIDLKKYPEIDIYYKILCDNAFRDDPNIITIDYVIKKLKNTLIRLGFAHTTSLMNKSYYYYWFDTEER